MASRPILLVLHYDGGDFAGWQIQPGQRTVQGVLEEALQRLCEQPVRATAAGRTDAGVHARGQSVGVQLPDKWNPRDARRALNAVLPWDIWVHSSQPMQHSFHPRFSAISRSYSYHVGMDEAARSPFRSRFEWWLQKPLDASLLARAAAEILGEHSFRAFAVQGTAPEDDLHICDVREAEWQATDTGFVFRINANRFLHHMVRFLVGTMADVACGKRHPETVRQLLLAADNREVSPPAPPHALFLEGVEYPADLYCADG